MREFKDRRSIRKYKRQEVPEEMIAALAGEASCCERNIMENILPRREARENAFLLAFSQTFGDVPLA